MIERPRFLKLVEFLKEKFPEWDQTECIEFATRIVRTVKEELMKSLEGIGEGES